MLIYTLKLMDLSLPVALKRKFNAIFVFSQSVLPTFTTFSDGGKAQT